MFRALVLLLLLAGVGFPASGMADCTITPPAGMTPAAIPPGATYSSIPPVHWGGTMGPGILYCWGDNASSQIGDTTTTDRTSPTLPSGGFTDWTSVATGSFNTCAIRAGRTYCWGNGSSGVGDGAIATRTTPSLIYGGFTDWTSITTGNTMCAIRSAGILYCWGSNTYGSVGDGTTTTPRTTPTLVYGGFTDWASISAGQFHVCGIRSGQAYCWGYQQYGRIGDDNTDSNRTTPSLVAGGFTDWTAIAPGTYHTCGIRSGRVYCWGQGTSGQIGDGNNATTPTPSLVAGDFTDWTAISSGLGHSCGLRAGRAYCWGTGGSFALGYGGSSNRVTPSQVSGSYADWTSIVAGNGFSCGTRNGIAYCWGSGTDGKIGDETTNNRATPRLVSGSFTDWSFVAAASSAIHSCGIRASPTSPAC